MVDAHQDVMARIACGEGMPDFYAREVTQDSQCYGDWSQDIYKDVNLLYGECRDMASYGYERDEQGWPLIKECNREPFFKYYTTVESLSIFDALYTNRLGLQDSFVNYWSALIAKFSSNPYIIGFDPINEPFPSDFIREPSILEPGVFDREKLAPLYERINEAMRRVSRHQIMYFETAEYPDWTPGHVRPAGFLTPPGGEVGSLNHVLNDHSYCCQLGPDICSTGEPAADKAVECENWHRDRIMTRAEDAKKLQIPLMITEFGACYDSEVCAREIRQVADYSDKALSIGWAYWQFKYYQDLTTTAGTGSQGFYNQDGSLQQHKLKALTRTYLQRIQGDLLQTSFNSESSHFEAIIKLDPEVSAPTVLFASREFWYPNGFRVHVSSVKTSKPVNYFIRETEVDNVFELEIDSKE
mmetsp:Transcript_4713/g.8048  ORF Transcript_4713/g.8048 Transcript_4713/m.8048 type:complete len:413 (+) Transcript_4713:394-1632(+)